MVISRFNQFRLSYTIQSMIRYKMSLRERTRDEPKRFPQEREGYGSVGLITHGLYDDCSISRSYI